MGEPKKRFSQRLFLPKQGSPLERDWPPIWSVSFADLTTLLMTAFILWYSLTAVAIPVEFLRIAPQRPITKEDVEYVQRLKRKVVPPEIMVTQVKKITSRQEKAIEEIKKLREFKEELKKYIATQLIEDVVEIEEGIEAILVRPRQPLLFDEGKAVLKEKGLGLLDKIVALLKEVPYYQLRIEGHTDIKPISPFHRYRYPSNWELSSARAVSVAKYFIEKGVPPQRIGVSGYGSEKPIFPNDTEENRAKNRRVDIYISFAKNQ